MTRSDLRGGDIIVSRKSWKESFAQAIFNSMCYCVGHRRYGDTGLYLESSHVRGVMPKCNEVFHWTAPYAVVEPLAEWMLDPGYAVIVRSKAPPPPPTVLTKNAFKSAGDGYNYGLLFDILIGWKIELFSLGMGNEVCSTGIGEWLAKSAWRRLIPADFLNLPEQYGILSEIKLFGETKLQVEPYTWKE